jgi:hypothetical protein
MFAPPKLPVPSTPYPDESLEGFIARGCNANGWDRPNQVLEILGHGKSQGLWSNRLSDEHAPMLAKQFGCKPEQLVGRFHRPVVVPETEVVFELFCGSPIRLNAREKTIRRISPAALRAADYHRAPWQLQPFKYCAETGEKLLGACPKCDKNLGWRKTYGIGFCEHCVEDGYALVDLRTVERPRLPDTDLSAYRAVTDLLSKPADRNDIFPRYFQSWPAWELLDLILTLGVMLVRCRDPGSSTKRSYIYSSFDWHANFMAAIRVAISWPDSATALVDDVLRVRASQDTGWSYGRMRKLGPFFNPEYYAGTPRIAFEIKSAVDRALPLTEEEQQRRWWRGGFRPSIRNEL